ncbi:unnamed protein product [Brachionus calyciflorus]|uniref:SWIM-type domain-containing protein n=1 Tax=Brachionus calyciflorus TaxID=104777 RepID=A0A814JMQ1_9BILA|nr:unnamed protein product [Brachionus calyciflorus]
MPLTNEKSSSLKIAKLIKKRFRSEKNHLDFLLTKHLDTKLIRSIEISKKEDFVQLTANEIVNRIFLGTYQLKLSKSYLNDLTTTNIAYIIDEKLIISIDDLDLRSQFSGTKIIAVEITSRHRRAEKNNSNYIPNEAVTKAIKGYICTCKSGQKIGCCVHVATLIYYLSYGQKNLIESPAKFLQKFFINFKNMDLPNKPKYLKNTRVNKIKEDLSINFSTESDLDETEEKNEDKKHIPKWGGLIRYRDIENVTLTNTCTIDNYLLALWHLSKIKPECFESEVFNELYLSLKDVLKLIDDLDWNLAKEKWINDFLKLTIVSKNNTISLFGTEQNFFQIR